MDPKKWLNEQGPLAGIFNFIGTEDNQKAIVQGCLTAIRPLVWIAGLSVGVGTCTMLLG